VLKSAFGWSMRTTSDMTTQEKERIYENRFHVTRVTLVTFKPAAAESSTWRCRRGWRSGWRSANGSRYFIVAAGGFATLVSPFLITINNHTLAATAAAVVLYAAVRLRDEGPRAMATPRRRPRGRLHGLP